MVKKPITQTEAKILVYLSVVHNTRKNLTAIAHKLEIDYSYVMRVLQAMVAKGWLMKHQVRRKMFYELTQESPLESAKNALLSDSLQKTLFSQGLDKEEVPQETEVPYESEKD